MKKRIFLTLLVMTLTAGGAFAQLSAGFGADLSVGFDSLKEGGGEMAVRTTGFGFFGFFDAKYVEIDAGMLFGGLTLSQSGGGQTETYDGPSVTVLTLAAYGKYPIDLGNFTLSPMIGLQMDLGLSAKQDGYKYESDEVSDMLTRFWIKLGASADFNLTEKIYLRPAFLWGLNFGPKYLRDIADLYDVSSFYHGLDIRVALGFKF